YLLGIDHDSLDSDVLKVGHHGSKTSSDEAFLAAVSPDYAIISAGKDNRYGHPHKEVIDALAALSIPVLGTYEEGTIIMESDGANIRLRQ
ncbi:MBL fold metallo-hydrolase, partial [bacterium]|nr:MBL fold metallo-hydrolase [bacterium]